MFEILSVVVTIEDRQGVTGTFVASTSPLKTSETNGKSSGQCSAKYQKQTFSMYIAIEINIEAKFLSPTRVVIYTSKDVER